MIWTIQNQEKIITAAKLTITYHRTNKITGICSTYFQHLHPFTNSILISFYQATRRTQYETPAWINHNVVRTPFPGMGRNLLRRAVENWNSKILILHSKRASDIQTRYNDQNLSIRLNIPRHLVWKLIGFRPFWVRQLRGRGVLWVSIEISFSGFNFLHCWSL